MDDKHLKGGFKILRDTLGLLKAIPDEYTPETWGIRCIEDHNKIIDDALAAIGPDWLERHDADLLFLPLANLDICKARLKVVRENLEDAIAEIAALRKDLIRAHERFEQSLVGLRNTNEALIKNIVAAELAKPPQPIVVTAESVCARDARLRADGRKAGLLEIAEWCDEWAGKGKWIGQEGSARHALTELSQELRRLASGG